MIKELAQYIVDNSDLEVGIDLFAGFLPQNAPSQCTAILESGGEWVSPNNKDRREKAIQIFTRAVTYQGARELAISVFDILINQIGIEIYQDDYVSGTPWWFIYNITGSAPQFLGIDEKRRFEFSTNLLVRAKQKES